MMKKNKAHNTIEAGYFYVGVDDSLRRYGRGKIGTTERSVKERASVIRSQGEKHFKPCAYLRLPNTTKARIEHIESRVRMKLEDYYQHTRNDHFEFTMRDKATGYNEFVRLALAFACETCIMEGFDYEVVHLHEYRKR